MKRHRAQQNERKLANRDRIPGPRAGIRQGLGGHEAETNSLGDPLQINNIAERQFDPLQEKAGVRRIVSRSAHTCATLALANGWQPHEVQRLLGHKRVEITLSIYAHVLPDRQKDMAESMAALLQG